MLTDASSAGGPNGKCPVCKGIPEHSEIEGSKGCMACDFTGTLAGHAEATQFEVKLMEDLVEETKVRQAYIARGICSQCGACNQIEAGTKCTASSGESGEYSCAGDDLWPEGG